MSRPHVVIGLLLTADSMKASPYNHFVEIEGGQTILVYNAFSGAVAEIDIDQYDIVKRILAFGESATTEAELQIRDCLRQGGFLVPDGVDQTNALNAKARADRLDGSILTLTIAPTLACNFACDYCFEARSPVRMNAETEAALISFSDNYMMRANALRICWFGGEPTLCLSTIQRLQSKFNELADKHRLKQYPATIITNGYLLDRRMAEALAALCINHAQITLDGTAQTHDRRRKLHSGKGTFERIVDNLCSIAGTMDITLRVNIDKDNVGAASDVVSLLYQRGILDKVHMSFAQVEPIGSVCSNIIDRCHDNREFAHTLTGIYARLLKDGLQQVEFPRPSAGGVCGALIEGYYVVSSTGHLFKCWEDLSMDGSKSIGTIFSPERSATQQSNLDRYRNWQPLRFHECRGCKVLPVCMGGCPARGMELTHPTSGSCASWKYNLPEMLALAYESARAKHTAETSL